MNLPREKDGGLHSTMTAAWITAVARAEQFKCQAQIQQLHNNYCWTVENKSWDFSLVFFYDEVCYAHSKFMNLQQSCFSSINGGELTYIVLMTGYFFF